MFLTNKPTHLVAHLLFFQLTKPSQKKQKSHQATALRHSKMTRQLTTEKEERTANIGFAKWRVTCFYDSLVLNQCAVLRLNFSAGNPPLRKAEKR